MKREEAFVWIDPMSGVVKIRTPYNSVFVLDLKREIPKEGRRWNKEDKVWEVEPQFLDQLINIASRYYNVRRHDGISQPVISDGDTSPYSQMLKLASNELIKKIYRLIANEVHPDRGGDPQAMSVLNDCFEKIKNERGI